VKKAQDIFLKILTMIKMSASKNLKVPKKSFLDIPHPSTSFPIAVIISSIIIISVIVRAV
jgi:hypothetical protein